jgi:hypothetical protein
MIRLFAFLIPTSLLLSVTMLRSGLNYPFGIGFWGPNGHDAVWHLSVINQFSRGLPPPNPIFSGTTLSNYHWGYDYLAFLVSKLTKLAPINVYFQLLPPLIAILIAYFSYKLISHYTTNKKAGFLFIFLNFFAGSAGWLYTLVRSGQIGGESLFWSMQGASTLINPPYALSLLVLLSGLYLWTVHRPKSNLITAFLLGVLFSTLTIIKIYAAILVGLSFSIFFIIKKIQKRATFFDLVLPISMAVFSLGMGLFAGLFNSGSLIIFQPFWFVHTMTESLDKLYLPRVSSLRANLWLNPYTWKFPFLIGIEAGLFLIFIIGNLGFRIFAFKTIFTKIRHHRLLPLDYFILPLMILGLLIPSLFIQKGTAWNTIQFFYYFLVFANFYLALFLSKQKSNIFIIVFLFFACITSISTLKDYFGTPPPSALPENEVIALDFLKQQPYGNVLSFPYDSGKKQGMSTPIPLYAYETTAYVSAFSGQASFLADQMNLDITGFDWPDRLSQSQKFFSGQYNKFQARGLLVNNQIDYLYLIGGQLLPYSLEDLQISQIFKQDQVQIFKVQR